MPEPVLEARGLYKTYRAGTPNEVPALRGVDLTVDQGSFVIVLGTNGSGKSTLLGAISGAARLDRGTVRLGGVEITGWPEERRAALIAQAFQNPFMGTASTLTVAENLTLALRRGRQISLHRALTDERRQRIRDQVASLEMGLENRLEATMGALSGGQRQALTLLMATLVRPSLLLLDEHTAALDPRSAEQVLRVTQQLVTRHGLTTIMVTHALQQAVRYGDRLLMMHQGQISDDFRGLKKRLLRADDLLARFDQLRNTEMLDESAAEMLSRTYV